MVVRRLAIVFVVIGWASASAHASGLRVTDAVLRRTVASPSAQWTVEVRVDWDNAWHNERNRDGAWLVVKVRAPGRGWRHALLGPEGHSVESGDAGVEGDLFASEDRVGLFVAPSGPHRGSVEWTVRASLAPETARVLDQIGLGAEVAVFGVEMVQIPSGAFHVGEVSEAGRAHGAFFLSDANGDPAGRYEVESESAIEVGAGQGRLNYSNEGPFHIYMGDREGPVPDEFPKGHRAFWCMKYELTQGQYAAFLNHLSPSDTAHRAVGAGLASLAADSRLTIRIEDGRYVADRPDRPANWVSWDDGCAWADWIGLRPMTELEFTKACRGPGETPTDDFPWGTADKEALQRVMGSDLDLVVPGAADESALSDGTRPALGASYYWVMDLAGSVWERCVTIGHPSGRAFRGTHGDGALNMGFATNDDWPSGDHAPGGYGYRGGGHYEASRVYEPGHFNPHSPVGWRRFGSWGQAPRSIAYGFRAVRAGEGP